METLKKIIENKNMDHVSIRISDITKCKEYLKVMLNVDLTLIYMNKGGEIIQIYTYEKHQQQTIEYCQVTGQNLFNEPIRIYQSINIRNIKKILSDIKPQPLPQIIYDNLIKLEKENNIKTMGKKILDQIFKDGVISDTRLAKLFYIYYPNKYIYDLTSKTWLTINNYGIYSWNDSDLISAKKILSSEMINHVTNYYKQIQHMDPDEYKIKIKIHNRLQKYLGNNSTQTSIIKVMQTLYAKDRVYEKMDTINDYIIGFNNGVYDIKNHIFRNAYPEELVSCSVGYDYDVPNNKYIDKINGLMTDIFPDKDEKKYILTILSHGLVGINENEQFDFWEGSGSNGKGLLESLVRLTLGDYSGTIDGKHFYKNNIQNPKSATPELASNKNSRIVFVNELNTQQDLDDNLIKKIIGRDPIECRELYKGLFKYVAKYSLIFLSNWKLKIDCSDEANVRRIRYESFPTKFVEEPTAANHRKLNIKLKENINDDIGYRLAFFHILLRHYIFYIKNNHKLILPKRFKEETEHFINTSDPVGSFIKDCIIPYPNKNIKSSDLYKSFDNYNEHQKNINSSKFKQILERKGYISIKSSCMIYKNICFVKNIKDKIEDFDSLNIDESSIEN